MSLSLDFLLNSFPAPQVLKIDVESHEGEVLRGASGMLSTIRPVIWCEVDPMNSEAVTDVFQQNEYRMFGAALTPPPVIKRAWWNTLAVPGEKIAGWNPAGSAEH